MKKYYLIATLLASIISIFYGFREFSSITETRTEEYALIDVEETGISTLIFITVGDSATRQILIEKKKKDPYNHALVFAQLKKLNDLGFEIVNESTSFNVSGGTGVVYSTLNHSYFFRRKLK